MINGIPAGLPFIGANIGIPLENSLTINGAGNLGINLLNTNVWSVIQTYNAGINVSLVNNSAEQTTIVGTTAGSIIASQPEQGASYKKVVIYLDGYENDSTTAQTYTFPVAFVNTPVASVNTTSIAGMTISNSSVSFAPDSTTIYTGFIIIEGY